MQRIRAQSTAQHPSAEAETSRNEGGFHDSDGGRPPSPLPSPSPSDWRLVADLLPHVLERLLERDVDVSVPLRELVSLHMAANRGPAYLSTTKAVELIGGNAKQWRRWAKEGMIPGAFQEGPAGTWRLPNEAARESYERRARRLSNGRRKLRGPRRKGPPKGPQTP